MPTPRKSKALARQHAQLQAQTQLQVSVTRIAQLFAHLELLPSDPKLITQAILVALYTIPGVARLPYLHDAPAAPATPASAGQYTYTLAWGAQQQGANVQTLVLNVSDPQAFAPYALILPGFCRLWARLQHMHAQAQTLQRSEHNFRHLFDNSPDPCWLIEDGRFTDCNQAAVNVLGYTRREDVLLQPERLSPQLQPDGQPSRVKAHALIKRAMHEGLIRFEWEHCRADGSSLPVEVTLARMQAQDRIFLYCVWRDITDRKQAEQEAHRLAFFDPLTGLPNRRLLQDRLQQSMAASTRSGKYRALLYLDLDSFKTLNDTQGHAAGDALLIETAQRLNTCVRETDTVARMGGDEFVLLLQQLDAEPQVAMVQAKKVSEKVLEELSRPYALPRGTTYQTSASIGVLLFIGQTLSEQDILQRADLAMYQAKAAGRNAVRFFDPAIQAGLSARTHLENEMRQAHQREEWLLYFQPQVDALGTCLGVEALLRWQHPQRGILGPGEFISLAEETGLIVVMGHWVLTQACATLAAWQHHPLTAGLSIAVNVCAKQFRQPDFVQQIRALIERSGINPTRLKLEITESLLLENMEQTIATMQELKNLGLRFALDDFGTGYSSLYYVKRLPLDEIKIDKSFVRDILDDPNDAAICRAVIAMGDSMGLKTVAEGVETSDQWDFLAQQGCSVAQGYWYARPMPLVALQAWLNRRAACA